MTELSLYHCMCAKAVEDDVIVALRKLAGELQLRYYAAGILMDSSDKRNVLAFADELAAVGVTSGQSVTVFPSCKWPFSPFRSRNVFAGCGSIPPDVDVDAFSARIGERWEPHATIMKTSKLQGKAKYSVRWGPVIWW